LARARLDVNRWRKQKGGLQRKDLEGAMKVASDRRWEGFTGHIRNGKLYVSRLQDGSESRPAAILMLTYLALPPDFVKTLPDTSFVINTVDEGPRELRDLPFMSFDRPTEHDDDALASFLVPDFTFFAWPESLIGPYDVALERIAQSRERWPFANRTSKLFWRGAQCANRNPLRDVRARLQGDADIEYISWGGWDAEHRIMPAHYVELSAQCEWKYIYSSIGMLGMYSSRMKYLFACGSLVFSPWPELEMEEYWYALMKPGENFAHARLDNLTQEFLAVKHGWPEHEQERVARAGSDMASLLDRQGAICYFQTLFREYANATVEAPPMPINAELIENTISVYLNAGIPEWHNRMHIH